MAKLKKITELTDEDLIFLYDNDKVKYEVTFEIIECIKLRGLIEETIVQLRNPKKKYLKATKDIANDVADTLQKILEASKK